LLDGFVAQVGAIAEPEGAVRGVIAPHIDYERGGATYAATWAAAAESVREADLVAILGTDHFGRPGGITLTRQGYETPFGLLPPAKTVVDATIDALGEESALDGELLHRAEHSVELSAIWVHHMRAGVPVEIVPVLCGSFGPFVRTAARPIADAGFDRFTTAFANAARGRRVLVVASADLSHVGPAFGGEPVVAPAAKDALRASDERLLAPVLEGDAEAFFDVFRHTRDATNVCGVPPVYLALRLLAAMSEAQVRGQQVAYEQCPADEAGASWVSVCGVLLR